MAFTQIAGALTGTVTEDTNFLPYGEVYVTGGTLTGKFFAGIFDGLYGALAISDAGAWSYTLNNALVTVQELGASTESHDIFFVSWGDGSVQGQIDINVIGSNDPATFSGDLLMTLNVSNTDHMTGQIQVTDKDMGEKEMQPSYSLEGELGALSVSKTGAWSYTLFAGMQTSILDQNKIYWDNFYLASKDGTVTPVTLRIGNTVSLQDLTAPVVSSFSPAANTINVALYSDIVLTFNEAISKGAGTITLKTTSGTTVASYDAETSNNLSLISNTLTINPTSDLGIYTDYTIEFSAGAVTDLVGNSYPGGDIYSFKTEALDSLYHFCIVAFNIAPGAEYMTQLATAYNAGMTIQDIVNVFTTKPQFTDVYPTSLSHAQLAISLTNAIVKISASAQTKSEAVNDITGALDAGWTLGDIIYTVFGNLANKSTTDADWGQTAQQFNNQLAVSKYYTEVMEQSVTDMTTLRAVIGNVDNHTDVSTPEIIATLIGVELASL